MSDAKPLAGEAVTPEEFSLLYAELRRMAHAQMSNERDGHTLQTTGLIHEAFLRLQRDGDFARGDKRAFYFAAAQAMRRILIEHARSRGRQKRGGKFKRISLDAVRWLHDEDSAQTLMLDELVCRLEQEAPDDAQVVRLRFYAGLSIDQTAEVLGASAATVQRRWRFARAWLWRELRAGNPDGVV